MQASNAVSANAQVRSKSPASTSAAQVCEPSRKSTRNNASLDFLKSAANKNDDSQNGSLAQQSVWVAKLASESLFQSPLVWIVSDVQGLRQHSFSNLGCRVISIWFGLHSKGKLQAMLNSLEDQKPRLLWIRLHGPCVGSGNRHDASRSANVAQLIFRQVSLGGLVVMEANARSEAWNLQALKPFQDGFVSALHQACCFCAVPRSNVVIRTLSNFDIGSRECQCSSEVEHVSWKTLSQHSQDVVMNSIISSIARETMRNVTPVHGSDGQDRQPESKNLMQAPVHSNSLQPEEQPPLRVSSLHASSKYNQRRSKSASHGTHAKAVRFTDNVDDLNQADSMSEVRAASSSPTIRPSKSQNQLGDKFHQSRQQQVIRNQQLVLLHNLVDSLIDFSKQTTPSDASSLQRKDLRPRESQSHKSNRIDAIATGQIVADSHDLQHSVPVDSDRCHFPTEDAERAKQRKKEGHVPVKRKKDLEIHHDDCGENLDSILPHLFEVQLERYKKTAETRQAQFEHDLFAFAASSSSGKSACKELNMSTFIALINSWSSSESVDIVELFGGDGLTSRILAKRFHFRSGQNFEALAGFDMSNPSDIACLWQYIKQHRPYVVVMAPPCGGFGPWTRLNRIIYPKTYHQTRQAGIGFAKLCASIGRFQRCCGNHFVVEQPSQSNMFDLDEWNEVLKDTFSCQFDQCRLGLKQSSPPFLPLLKPTQMRSTHETMLTLFYFEGFQPLPAT